MILTTSRIRVLPYKQGSRSAKALADALGGKVLKLENSAYLPRDTDYIINWGNNTFRCDLVWGWDWPVKQDFNLSVALDRITNKLKFFEFMEGNDWLPKFWTNKDEIPNEEFPIVCRTVLSGHSGNGIHIAATRDDLVECSLYVKYIKKKDEYRVHMGKTPSGELRSFAVQRKAKRIGQDPLNWQVRNLANGFVFVRDGVSPPPAVIDVARDVFNQSYLDFGAVDVIWNEHQQRAYVLEINTAPGLEGQTITDYADFFKEFM